MTRKNQMEDITNHILSSFEERCKCLENLAQEFKNMLKKTTFQHQERVENNKEIQGQVEKILFNAEALLQDIEKERINTALIFDSIVSAPKGKKKI